MRVKYSWIFFIPIAILSVVLRVYQLLFVDNGIDKNFLTSGRIWLIYAIMVAVLFVIIFILCVTDKKTPYGYEPKSNFMAGISGVLAAGVIIFHAGMQAGAIFSENITEDTPLVLMLNAISGLLGGVILLLMGLSSFSGRNIVRKTGVLSSLAVIWCSIQMIETFIVYTKHSIHEYDTTNLFYMSFLTLAIFHISMMYQNITFKNTVKGTFLYGMPGFVTVTVYSVADAIKQYNATGKYDIIGSLDVISFVLIGFYVLFMMTELTVKVGKEMETYTQTEENYVGKAALQIEETPAVKDEVMAEELAESEIKSIDVSDVEESVNEELDEVDEVIESMKREANNPENYSPYAEEYFNRRTNSPSADKEIEKSLEDIDKLIDEIHWDNNED